MSKRTWEASSPRPSVRRTLRGALAWLRVASAALPLAAGMWLAAEARADQSILIRSSSATPATASATASQGGPAALTSVTTQFTPSGSAPATAAAEEGAIKLKWRARHPSSFALGGAKVDPAVRQATQLTELNDANPFDDPFDDRRSAQLSAPRSSADSQGSVFREIGSRQPLGEAEGLPQQRTPGREVPQGGFFSPPRRDPCADCPDKCYNQRNCCREGANCLTAQQLIRSFPIEEISLNISPSIKPGAKSLEEMEQERNSRLFQAKSRVWRDRKNEVVAEGNLLDYRWDRVYIATADGETVKVPFVDLSNEDRCFVTAWWEIPAICTLADDEYVARAHSPLTMTWTASQVCHKPLYFEERALERYGHTTGPLLQPWISGAHFFTNIAVMPYKMGINPLNECQYDLGYYRPGNCAPWLVSPLPLSPRGALFQAGAVTGVSFLIP